MARSRRRRFGATVAVGVAVAVTLAGCAVFSSSTEPGQGTVLIGADLELTGTGSERGAVYHQALQLRVEQVNEQGLLGDRRLELIVLDNRSDSSTAAANLAELARNPAVTAIVTGGCSECTLAAVDTINEAGVPTIALAGASELTEPIEERRYLFKLGPGAADVARVLGAEAGRIEATTIGVLTTDDLYGREGREAMARVAERAGVEIVVSESVAGDEASIAAAASAILEYRPDTAEPEFVEPPVPPQPPDPEEQTGPDAVVVWAPDAITSQLALTLRDQGYEGQLLLDASAANELFLSGGAGAALRGARIVFTETLVIDGVIATSPAKAARQNWFNAYTARQGTYHAYSSFAADAIEVVVAAVNQFDNADRDTVRDALENTQVDGFSGPIRFRLENHAGLNPQALVTLVAQGDRWRLSTG